MTPKEYFETVLCNPGNPVGYQFCLIDTDAKTNGWTLDQVANLKHMVEIRDRNSFRFPFPKVVRYV